MEKENKIDKFYQNFIYRQGNMWYGGDVNFTGRDT